MAGLLSRSSMNADRAMVARGAFISIHAPGLLFELGRHSSPRQSVGGTTKVRAENHILSFTWYHRFTLAVDCRSGFEGENLQRIAEILQILDEKAAAPKEQGKAREIADGAPEPGRSRNSGPLV
jgi:hypothetical protein